MLQISPKTFFGSKNNSNTFTGVQHCILVLALVHVLKGHVCTPPWGAAALHKTQVAVDAVTFYNPYTSWLLTVAVTEEAGSELRSRVAGKSSHKHTWDSISTSHPAANGPSLWTWMVSWLWCSYMGLLIVPAISWSPFNHFLDGSLGKKKRCLNSFPCLFS